MEKEPKWEVVSDEPKDPGRGKRTGKYAGIGLLLVVAIVLVVIFPPVLAFVELAARQLRYLWWLVLLLALGIWLVIGTRKSKK
ncbi:MAG: hypothetical protein R3F07_08280 [Opitutaceae bacterium]